MAKPTSPVSEVIDMLKKHGPGGTQVIRFGDDEKNIFVPCGIPTVDLLARKGGFPAGRLSVLTGQTGTGKTATCYGIMAHAIVVHGWPCFYMDTEGRYEENIAIANGVPTDDHEHFWLSEYEPIDPRLTPKEQAQRLSITVQNLPSIVRDFANSQAVLDAGGGVFVLDSMNNLMIQSYEQGVEPGGAAGNFEVPKVFSQWGRELGSLLKARNILMVVTIQERGNVAMGPAAGHASKTVVPGGYAIGYNNSLLIKYEKFKRESEGSGDKIKFIGQWIKVTAVKSTGGRFGATGTFLLTPEYGPDLVREILKYGAMYGLVTVAGAFYTLHLPEGPQKFQGVAKVRSFLMSDPALIASLRDEILIRATTGWTSPEVLPVEEMVDETDVAPEAEEEFNDE